jgi:hypothetical protein
LFEGFLRTISPPVAKEIREQIRKANPSFSPYTKAVTAGKSKNAPSKLSTQPII